jgi:hypothetical protein
MTPSEEDLETRKVAAAALNFSGLLAMLLVRHGLLTIEEVFALARQAGAGDEELESYLVMALSAG